MRPMRRYAGGRVTDKSRATAVSLSPLFPPLGSDPRCYPAGAAKNGGRGCNRWSRSVACVPTAAKERASHGGER